MLGSRSAGSVTFSRVMNAAPSGNASVVAEATSIARRLFPTPPGPRRVTRRLAGSASSAATAATSSSRPISRVYADGTRAATAGVGAAAGAREASNRSASSVARSASISSASSSGVSKALYDAVSSDWMRRMS